MTPPAGGREAARTAEADPRLAEPGGHQRRARDAAMALPVLGILLLASPFTAAFGIGGSLFGVPVVVVYVFVAWAALIWGAWAIGRRIRAMPAPDPQRPRPRPARR